MLVVGISERRGLQPRRHAMRTVLIAAALSAVLLATADAKEQRGTIISVDDAAKTFVCQWGSKDWTYKTTKKTGIRISNRDGSWSDLKIGARINVGYHTVGEDRVADWVVILRRVPSSRLIASGSYRSDPFALPAVMAGLGSAHDQRGTLSHAHAGRSCDDGGRLRSSRHGDLIQRDGRPTKPPSRSPRE